MFCDVMHHGISDIISPSPTGYELKKILIRENRSLQHLRKKHRESPVSSELRLYPTFLSCVCVNLRTNMNLD